MVQGPLGKAIEQRISMLGVSVKAFTDAGYISSSTYFRVVSGKAGVRHGANTAALERGLGWVTGSVHQVRSGGEAIPIPVRTWPRADGDWKAAVERAWGEWDEKLERAVPPPSVHGGTDSVEADPVTVALSREIRVWLIRRDMTESDLADAIRMSTGELALRLHAKTDWTVNELLAVAQVLHVSPSVLLDGEAESVPTGDLLGPPHMKPTTGPSTYSGEPPHADTPSSLKRPD
jgi:hypothetical protein